MTQLTPSPDFAPLDDLDAVADARQLRRDLPEHSEHVARVRATLATLAPWFGAAVVPASAAIAA